MAFLCDLCVSHADCWTYSLQIRIGSQQFDGYAAHPGQLAPNNDIPHNSLLGENAMDTEQANDDGVSDTAMETSKTDGLENGANGGSALENGANGKEDNKVANKDGGSKEEPLLEDSSTKNEDNEANNDDGNVVPRESNPDGTTTMEE